MSLKEYPQYGVYGMWIVLERKHISKIPNSFVCKQDERMKNGKKMVLQANIAMYSGGKLKE